MCTHMTYVTWLADVLGSGAGGHAGRDHDAELERMRQVASQPRSSIIADMRSGTRRASLITSNLLRQLNVRPTLPPITLPLLA